MADRDEFEGQVKETTGRFTGDEDLENEGRVQGAWGDVKDTADDVKDTAEDKWEDLKD